MELKILDALLSEFQKEVLGPGTPEARELARFHEFLVKHGGLRRLEVPGKQAQILEQAEALRCFHFSQYLDWYLTEKVGASRRELEVARAAMKHLNEWLLERQAITHDAFEENQESILGSEAGPPVYEDVVGSEEEDPEAGVSSVREEKDFYVPGEYSSTLSGEFIITKVQEGILYGEHRVDGREVGPILVDRAVSSGHKVGDRVHLSLGKAGDHWNLLSVGRRRE